MKIFISILTARLTNYVETGGLLPEFQFGFRKGRSTISATQTLSDIIENRLRSGRRTHVCYIDFTKAFDKVDRGLLFKKLIKLGIPHKICILISFIFDNTKTAIRSGKYMSEQFITRNGVPQGAEISPVLFALFISDIGDSLPKSGIEFNGVNIPYLAYADDLAQPSTSQEELENQINSLVGYCNENKLVINVTKTKEMVFYKGRLPKMKLLSIYGKEIDHVNTFCYLGVTFSSKLSFSEHIKLQNMKARTKIGFLYTKFNIQMLPFQLAKKIFHIYVVPIFSYGIAIWWNKISKNAITAINATWTKYLKRALGLPVNANTNFLHFITETSTLYDILENIFIQQQTSTRFPHLPGYVSNITNLVTETKENRPSYFWMSRAIKCIPLNFGYRKKLFLEIFGYKHHEFCDFKGFHSHFLDQRQTGGYLNCRHVIDSKRKVKVTCQCGICGNEMSFYHELFCNGKTTKPKLQNTNKICSIVLTPVKMVPIITPLKLVPLIRPLKLVPLISPLKMETIIADSNSKDNRRIRRPNRKYLLGVWKN